MSNTGIIGLLLIAFTVLFSYRGFTNNAFFERYQFEVTQVLAYRDYKRMITSGFLHVNWMHLLFNMFTLFFFASGLELYLGLLPFLLVYFAGLIGGNLFSLFIHRNEGDYSAVGASGAIAGLIYASIALFPGMSIPLFPLPIYLPGWLYGLLFVAFSIYAVRSRRDNVGHDAHLGGALIGMLVALALHPGALLNNYPTILIISLPTIVFIYIIVKHPGFLLVDNYFFKQHNDFYSIDHKYNAAHRSKQEEIDRILDKINRKGMGSLTSKEKQALKEYSER